jgi:hypothetical protein
VSVSAYTKRYLEKILDICIEPKVEIRLLLIPKSLCNNKQALSLQPNPESAPDVSLGLDGPGALMALPDLGPVLAPLGSCCLPVTCLGSQKFPFGAPNSAPRAELVACSD